MFRFFRYTTPTVYRAGVAFSFQVLVLTVGALLVAPLNAAPAPVVDAAAQGPAMKAMEQRIKRLENRADSQSLIELIKRVDNLQMEVQRLVGDIEVFSHELKGIQKRQRDVYSDLDNRLRKLEQALTNSGGGATGSSTNVPVTPATGLVSGQDTAPGASQAPPPAVADPMTDAEQNVARSAYERAFNMLKQGRYDLAISLFDAFLETYPSASYADNAQYWLGEANYANRKYKVALTEFKKVIDKYPNSPKRPDALLKMGYTYGELGDKRAALQTLNTIVNLFPDTTAARLAKKRIKSLNSNR